MNRTGLIQCLILLAVVSLAVAGVYAAEASEVPHADSGNNGNGFHISGSSDVCHVSSCYRPLNEISTLELGN